MPPAHDQLLIRAAIEARKKAVAPYSKFKVGAAVLTRSGEIVTGANVENASYGLTCCAERVAMFKALTDGLRGFVAIGIVARIDGGPMPCGACRQILSEFAPKATGYVADTRSPAKIREFEMSELRTFAFGELRDALTSPKILVQGFRPRPM
jgi:cytidine deaminase